jgi:hypothetical protein
MESDRLLAIPSPMMTEAKITERTESRGADPSAPTPLRAGLNGARLGAALLKNPNLGATLGIGHGLGIAIAALQLKHAWIVDVFTKDVTTPLVTLDFGGDSETAKLCHATLRLVACGSMNDDGNC